MDIVKQPRYLLEYGLAQAGLFIARSLPLDAAPKAGEWAGRQLAIFMPGRTRIAVDNLLNAFPGMSERAAQRMALRVYEHFGRAAVESVLAYRLLRPSTYRRHVVFRNEDRLRKVLAEGKGAILVTGHIGVWEIPGLVLGRSGPPPHSVYRPAKNPFIDRMVRRHRSALGQVMVEREGALKRLLRILRAGGYIALLADQHAKADGVWVPFFGRPASTTPAPALLSLRTGAPIITGYAVRVPGVYRFEAFYDEPIYPGGDLRRDDREAAVRRITLEISRRMERYVRMFPDQWLWMHRRWRNPPPGI